MYRLVPGCEHRTARGVTLVFRPRAFRCIDLVGHSAAFKMACESLVDARRNGTGVTPQECCTRAEEQCDLPLGCVTPGRILKKVIEAEKTQQPVEFILVPRRRPT